MKRTIRNIWIEAETWANPPRFLSPAFHLDFFPKVLVYRYRHYKSRDRNKKDHVLFEIPLMIAACGVTAAVGFPRALVGSFAGIVISAVGSLGLIAMVAGAVVSEYRCRVRSRYTYAYESFSPSIFIFFVMMGLTGGILTGGVLYESLTVAVLGALAGFLAGYVAGIFAGLWIYGLGFMAVWFIYLANVVSAFMLVENCIVVFLILK